MGMCMVLHSLSDQNILRIQTEPELIWRLIAADDPDAYLQVVQEKNRSGIWARLFGQAKVSPPELVSLSYADGENVDIDLDKSWQGIHYCLNETAYEAESPMDFITLGGEEAGTVEVGYGPARLFDSPTVREISALLHDISAEQLKVNYDPQRMQKLDIYPNIWEREGDDGFEYIAEYYNILKQFINHCSNHQLGMAIYLC